MAVAAAGLVGSGAVFPIAFRIGTGRGFGSGGMFRCGFHGLDGSLAGRFGRGCRKGVDRGFRGSYISVHRLRGGGLARLCGSGFTLVRWLEVRLFRGRGFPFRRLRVGGLRPATALAVGSLTIWFEGREAWTAGLLRAPSDRRRVEEIGGLRFSRKHPDAGAGGFGRSGPCVRAV